MATILSKFTVLCLFSYFVVYFLKLKSCFIIESFIIFMSCGVLLPGLVQDCTQDTNCTATCPLSRKLFKLGEPDMQDIAGEAEMNS